jgi:hypothetical protein
MKIAFLDPIGWDYTPLTPFERPLGGAAATAASLVRTDREDASAPRR